MAGKAPCFLFKQTRVNLDWSDKTPNHNTDVALPRHPSARPNRILTLRNKKRSEPLDSEEKFKLAQHATHASVYYRPAARFPRCILWRIVEDWSVLTLSAVDFTKPDAQSELGRTVRFVFPEQIQPGGVGFADAPHHDELVVYALTQSGVLYTLRLSQEFFANIARGRGAPRPEDFCSLYMASSFQTSRPHLLMPINDESLVVSVRDGKNVKLQRLSTLDGSTTARYSETSFSESSLWGHLKLKMPWVGATTVPYMDHTVYHTTVVSGLAYYPPPEYAHAADYRANMRPVLFTASVDHTLKAWSLDNGTLLQQTDLLNEQHANSSNMGNWLDPAPSRLLQVVERTFQEDHMFYLISFSSASTGKFKIWAATHDDGAFRALVDLYPNISFQADPPGGTAPWIISEFRVTPIKDTRFNLWVLWKSDTNFRIQNLEFDITDVTKTWGQWATATLDSTHEIPSRQSNLQTADDVTDSWMKWIFYPGRFPDTVLESALLIYEHNFSVPEENPTQHEPIEAKVRRLVEVSVKVETDLTGQADEEKHRVGLELQWERFGRLCTELDKDRGEALSLVTDPVSGYVWTVNVDGITALRECTESEVIKHNCAAVGDETALTTLSQRTPKKLGAGLQGQELKDVMLLATCGTELWTSLSEDAQDKCILRLHEEVVKDPLFSVGDLMEALYEDCIYEEVPDETYGRIEDLFNEMENPEVAFQSILSSLFQSDTSSGQTRLTAFGAKVLVGGSQEVIQVNHEMLFNLVFLLVHVTFCDDQDPFHHLTNTPSIYQQLLNYFREYEVLKWMATNTAPLSPKSANDDISQALTDLRVTEAASDRSEKRGSVLQLVLPEIFGPSPPAAGASGSVALSVCIRRFLAGLDLADHGNGIADVATALLNAGASATALDFAEFLPTTTWGAYMKARIHLANRKHVAAAALFHRAAFGMASEPHPQNFLSTRIFANDWERAYAVGGGPGKYHLHVAKLFEDNSAPDYVVDFCNSALLAGSDNDENLRSEILVKKFHAALKVERWDEAYLALTSFSKKPLQHASVRELVAAMVEKEQGARLISYPFVGLQDDVDEALEGKCEQIIDVGTAPPYHKVLYAWRIQRGDYRAAATVLYERLQKLQTANVGSTDPSARTVTDAYLALINVLSCVEEDQAWILSTQREEAEPTVSTGAKRARLESGANKVTHRRKVLTLADIRAGYQTEVERVGLLLNGGFFV